MRFVKVGSATSRAALSLLLACAAAFAGAAALVPAAARADNLWVYSCGWWDNNAPAFLPTWGTPNLTAQRNCQQADKALEMDNAGGSIAPHAIASWYTTSPSGVSIDYAYTPPNSMRVSCELNGAGLEAWWAVNGAQYRISQPSSCDNGMGDGGEIGGPVPPGQSFQFYVWCANSSSVCSPLSTPAVEVQGIELGATENGAPSLLALDSNNLFYQGGRWVRGAGWPISLQASDVSGVCDMRAFLNGFNGQLIQGPTAAPDQTVWDQCDPSGALQQWPASVDTTGYPNGSALQLTFQAENAALNWKTSPTSTSYVDNTPVDLFLSGPSQAPGIAGPQDVTATATAGPSGVGAIMCSVDGSPSTAQHMIGAGKQTATAQVPVSGLGSHQVSCHATNRAVDASGTPASSPTATWSVKIGEPVIAGISFSRVIRHCGSVRRPVTIPAHWATVTRRHKRVHVRVPARTRREWVTACKVRSRAHARKLVAFGHGATVGGWLETANHSVVTGAQVRIMAAAYNGLHRWRQVALVTTSADGGWRASLRSGPSRLIEAVYAGGPLTESATSRIVKLSVPARIRVSVSPRSIPWSHSITVRGRLLGGYVPRDGVALRLLIRYAGSPQPTDLFAFRTSRTGTFRITFAFGAGHGAETLPIWVATTASESDYPFAASASNSTLVTFR